MSRNAAQLGVEPDGRCDDSTAAALHLVESAISPSDRHSVTRKPEVIRSSVGLVPTNALVLTGLATFRLVGKPQVILSLRFVRWLGCQRIYIPSDYRKLTYHLSHKT